MGKSLWDKILRWIGFEVEEAEDQPRENRSMPEVSEEWVEDLPQGGKRRGTLVSLPGQKQVKVVVVEPRSFEEVQSVADHLKSRRPIILNLETTDREHAQRILNFLSGTIYALNGEMQRISNGIFFFAPSNVDVALMRRTVKATEPPPEAGKAGLPDFVPGQARDLVERRSGLNLNLSGLGGRPEQAGDKDRPLQLWNK